MTRHPASVALAALFTLVAHASQPSSGSPPTARPFYVSVAAGKPADTTEDKTLPEFSGYLQLGDDTEVSLKNSATGRSCWVGLRDPQAAYFVECFDPATRSLIVRIRGVGRRVALRNESSEPYAGHALPEPAAGPALSEPPDYGVIPGKFGGLTREGKSRKYWHPRGPYTVEGPGGVDPDDPGLAD